MVRIKYNGKIYTGTATCSEEDMDFESKKVGTRIAISRARSLIMKSVLKEEVKAQDIKAGFYGEYKKLMDAELRVLMFDNLLRQYKQIKQLRQAIHNENKSLTLYLKSQEDFIKRIRKNREKGQM